MIDRAQLLRRAGVGAAALFPLIAAAEARAEGGGNFPEHPRWRFAFVHHETTDPLLIAAQFGAQDACALVECDYRWLGSAESNVNDAVRTARTVLREKHDGLALAIPKPGVYDAVLSEARRVRVPVVAFNIKAGGGTLPYVGQNHYEAGAEAGRRLLRAVKSGEIVFVAPDGAAAHVARRQAGALAVLAESATHVTTTVTYRGGRPAAERAVERVYASQPRVRALVGLTSEATAAIAVVGKRRGLRRALGAGFDLLPNEYPRILDGSLDFVLDQQPYLQGFAAVLQLFLSRISEGILRPADVLVPPLVLDKAALRPYLATKSRFEGTSSRHAFPLPRA